MKRRVSVEQRPYPVDECGFPIPVEELELPYLRSNFENNHHLNFNARSFGRFAISETFRTLESFQTMMPEKTHELLHQRYSGIKLPRLDDMIDRIEQAKDEGEHLKVRAYGGYVLHNITDIHIKTLKAEYNQQKEVA